MKATNYQNWTKRFCQDRKKRQTKSIFKIFEKSKSIYYVVVCVGIYSKATIKDIYRSKFPNQSAKFLHNFEQESYMPYLDCPTVL